MDGHWGGGRCCVWFRWQEEGNGLDQSAPNVLVARAPARFSRPPGPRAASGSPVGRARVTLLIHC